MRALWSSAPIRVLALWGAFIVYGTTIPFDLHPGFWTASQGWEKAHKIPWVDPEGGLASLPDALTNVLLFLPWGFLLALHLGRRGAGRRVTLIACGASAFCVSLGVEVLQLLSSARISSATDLANNTIGGVLGGVVGWLTVTRGRAAVEPWFAAARRREPVTLVALAVMLGILLWSVAPFDLSLDVDDVKSSLKSTRLVPFGPPLRGDTPAPRPGKQVATMLAWSLIGGVFVLAYRGRGSPRPVAAGAVSVLAVAAASELSQLLIRSRTVDATTIVYALVGGGAGAAIAGSRLGRAPRSWIPLATGVWLLATLASGLEPWRFSAADPGPVGWVPFAHYFERTDAYALADAMMSLLLYAPLGFLLAARDRTLGVFRAGVAGMLVAALVEGGQILLPDRVTDVTDVLLGGAGATFGVWLSSRVGRALVTVAPIS